jgi:hypothetical protein
MHEEHKSTTTLKFSLLICIKQDKSGTPERHNNRGIRETLPMKQFIGSCPNLLLRKIGRGNIVDKLGRFKGMNPHKKWGTCINHAKRSHNRYTPNIALREILLGPVGTDKSTLDIAAA